jgi:hypothetical protein
VPKTVFFYNGRYITWKLHDPNRAHDFKTDRNGGVISIGNLTQVAVDETYIVNITKLKDDIKTSESI